MKKEFLPQPSNYPHAHCASLVLHKGQVFCTWYAYPEDECKDAKIMLAAFDHSKRRWKESIMAFPNTKTSQGNPLLFSYQEKLYLLFVLLDGAYWNSAKTYISVFDEVKNEFEAPLKTNLEQGMMIRHRPQIHNGKFLLPAYDEKNFQSIIMTSKPPFMNYEKVGSLEPGPIQGDLLPTGPDDGKNMLWVLRGTGDARFVHRAHTMDGGKTFPFSYRTPFHCPLSGVAAVKLDEERIILAHNDTEEQKRTPLTLTFSKDTFKSRTGKWDLESSEGEYSYPSFVRDNEGNIHLAYTHNREKIGHYFFHEEDFKSYWEEN